MIGNEKKIKTSRTRTLLFLYFLPSFHYSSLHHPLYSFIPLFLFSPSLPLSPSTSHPTPSSSIHYANSSSSRLSLMHPPDPCYSCHATLIILDFYRFAWMCTVPPWSTLATCKPLGHLHHQARCQGRAACRRRYHKCQLQKWRFK